MNPYTGNYNPAIPVVGADTGTGIGGYEGAYTPLINGVSYPIDNMVVAYILAGAALGNASGDLKVTVTYRIRSAWVKTNDLPQDIAVLP